MPLFSLLENKAKNTKQHLTMAKNTFLAKWPGGELLADSSPLVFYYG